MALDLDYQIVWFYGIVGGWSCINFYNFKIGFTFYLHNFKNHPGNHFMAFKLKYS